MSDQHLFQDLTVSSANKQRHRVMKKPALGCTACHHDHSKEQISVQNTVPYQSSWFQSSPSTHFIFANEQAVSPSQAETFPQRTCCGIEGLCSLSKFSTVKSKPSSCNNSFNWTVLPTTEALQFLSNFVLKSLCCSLCLFLQFSSLSLLWEALQNKPLYKKMCKWSAQCLIL